MRDDTLLVEFGRACTPLVAGILALAWPASGVVAEDGGQDTIVMYPAYASGGNGVVEGRVVEREEAARAVAEDGRRANLRRNLGLLVNDERAGVPVTVRLGERRWSATTDDEGYFRIVLDDVPGSAPGWHRISGQVGASVATTEAIASARTTPATGATTETGLLVTSPRNGHGIISDVDDTIVITEVTRFRRLLRNTLLRNPLQREAVPGMAALYRRLAARNAIADAAPVFYLSASPRQLHFAIETFLAHNEFPQGVLITKRVTNDGSSEPLRDQVAYKKAKIEEILTRLPDVRFTLIGDDGEQDPEIYRAIRDAFPDRVEAIWIRRVRGGQRPAYEGQGDLRDALAAR